MNAADVAIAWAAGLIDGEGCIGFVTSSDRVGGGHWQLRVQMGHRGAIERLVDIFGGRVSHQVRPAPRGQYWGWYCPIGFMASALRRLIPFLIVKREPAEHALRWLETRGTR